MEFLHWLSGLRTDLLDSLFLLITGLSSKTFAILFICILYWCFDKRLGLSIAFTWFLSAILVNGLKIGVRIERPWIIDPTFKVVDGALEGATGYSFPSGHTQSAFGMYGSFGILQKRKWLRIIMLVIAALIGFSRLYLGVHTPLDVLTAMALTLLILAFVKVYWYDQTPSVKHDSVIAIVMAVLSATLILLGIVLLIRSIIDFEYLRDALQVAGAGFGFSAGFLFERRFVNFDPKDASIPKQILKVALGILGTLLIQSAVSLPFLEPISAALIGYILLTFWIVGLFPYLFSKMNAKQIEKS